MRKNKINEESFKNSKNELKRNVSGFLLTIYGLGTILGAGIYVLIGKVTAVSGVYAPIAFLIAALIAFFSGISYAELASRFPYSAGEAYYVKQGFGQKWLAGLTGWLVVLTGVVSAATLAKGFVGYFQIFFNLPASMIVIIFVCSLGILAVWGIMQSVIISMFITFMEIFGIILVLIIAGHHFENISTKFLELIPALSLKNLYIIVLGAFVAFYAFIGFEDIVNIAEEVKNPQRTIPIAIFSACAIATILYFLIALLAILALPIALLIKSKVPLALLVEQQGFSPKLISLISLIAIINGALVQIIMASRVIYGMAKQQNAPLAFATIHKKTQTPILSTFVITVIILILALLFPLFSLAKATSFIILFVFLLMNLSLIIIKIRNKKQAEISAKNYSILFPICGALLILIFISVQVFKFLI